MRDKVESCIMAIWIIFIIALMSLVISLIINM